MSRTRGYLYGALITTLNVVVYAATLGRHIVLEGRVSRGTCSNWLGQFRYRPRRFAQPSTEAELAELVLNSTGVRLLGSGHSFNDGVVADDTLVSLDRYAGVLWKDLEKKRVAFKAGTRVRDAVRELQEDGLAFRALPSHDAQSLGGILSTDVHGTGGADWGFVSQSVVRLKVMDGRGDAHECEPADDLFRAAVGGVGAVGIITEVVVQGVDRFNVEQRVEPATLSFVKDNLDRLLLENDHFSVYVFPFTDRCQVNTWNHTTSKRSPLGPVREFLTTAAESLLAAWVGNLLAYTKLLPTLSAATHSLIRTRSLVMESSQAFNRTLYHLHQELEFTVPHAETFEACERFLHLYETLYRSERLPYAFLELRFTPAGHDRTLIGAGRERRCTWIDLLCDDSPGVHTYFEAAEKLMKEIGARPHLGKYCQEYRKADLMELHQENFTKFLELMEVHDADKKFANQFTRRLFG
ncbi:MAG: FAD-binding protein [Actinomycetota bacterium]|nr:FAD-binding protein [Actinomycetota bacterium]